MREATLLSVVHPEYLDDGALLRVDHPTVDPLSQGAPALGWEGDTRTAVYLHLASKRFVVYRLEANGEYRPFARLPEGAELSPESINKLIVRLVEIDSRRGFDPLKDVYAARAAVERQQRSERQAWVEDFADKFRWALSRSHLPGVDVGKPLITLGG